MVGRDLSTSATIPLESSVLAGDKIRCLNSDAKEMFVRERAANLNVHGEVARILIELCLGMRSSPSSRSAHAILPTNLSEIVYRDCTHLLVVPWSPEMQLGD